MKNVTHTQLAVRRGLAPLLPFLVALATGCSTSTRPRIIPPISKVEILPETDTLQVGQLGRFTATAFDTNLIAVQVSFLWTSSDPLVASVNTIGQVQAHAEGSALIVAEVGGQSDTALVAVYPDTGWIVQTSNALEDLHGVCFRPDARTGWAVGDAGLILSTIDAGATWSRRIASTFGLNAVWFWSDVEGCAVGNLGTVLRTVLTPQGTLNWVPADTVNASQNLYDVTFARGDSLVGFAVGANGVILRSINAGRRWEKQFIPGGQNLRGVSFAGDLDGWAVGDNGVIAGTHDRGLTWFVVQPAITTQGLKSVWRPNLLRAIAVGAQGVAPITVAGPDSIAWSLGNAGASFGLEGVAFGDSVAFAVGDIGGAGAILRSDDFGASWAPQTARSQYPLNDVYFVDLVHGWAVGNNGTIRHTARGGRQ